MLLASQVRAARGLLNWSQAQLAEAAAVGESTVRNFEAGRSNPMGNNLAAIQRAVELAGVEFTNGGQPGVRMKADAVAASAVIAKGAEARGKAKTAVDEALADVDAGHDEKAARKRKLTSLPKELKP